MNSGDPDYKDAIEHYNQQAEIYNNRLVGLRESITKYNAQVKVFNACVVQKGTATTAH